MNVLVIAAEHETEQRLASAAEAAGFVAARGGEESPLPFATDVLVLDGFDGGHLGGHVRKLLAEASPRPYVLAGVAPEADALDEGLAAGIDEFYPAGYERSLVFRLTLHDRRETAARLSREVDQRIEQANDVIYTVDFTGTFTSANAAAERLTGYRREQLVGMNMSELLLPGYLEVCQAAIRAKLAGDEDSSFFEVQIRHADGNPRWVEISSQLLTEGGRPVAVQGIARDLSRRRELDREIVFRAELLETMPTPAFAVDLRGTVLFWNRAATELFQIPADAATGSDVLDRIMGAELAQATRDSLSAEGGPGTHSNELTLYRADGTEFIAHVASSPLEDSEGRTFGAIAICVDVTNQRRQEEQIRLMATIVESAAIAAFTRSLDGTVTSWNPAAERMFGWTAEEAIGARLTRMVPDSERVRLGAQFGVILGGGRMDEETVRLHKDGREVPVRLTSDALRDETGAIVGTATLLYDLSERKASESELGETRAQLRAIFESTSEAVLVFDADLRLITANNAGLAGARAIFGSAPAKADNLRRWVLDRDWDNFQANAARAFRGDRVQVESPMPTLDGGERSFDYTFNPVRDESGRIYAVAMMARDITEQVRLEAEERAARAKADGLALIVESANDAILGLDMERRIVSWSSGAERVYGYSADEALGQPISLIYVDDPSVVALALERLSQVYAGRTYANSPAVRRHKSGRRVDVMVSAFPLRDGEGHIVGVGSTATDVTDQRRAEAALGAMAADLKAVFASTREQLVFLDADAHVVSVNAAAAASMLRVWGREILPGEDMRRWMEPADVRQFEENMARALAGETVEFERSATVNGATYAFEISYSPIRLEDGAIRGVLLGSRDVTERKRTSDALLQTQKLESLAVLAGGIAHDFNNLLVGILGNAGLALMEMAPNSPARETIEAIETAGQRAAELARQMLAYSGKGRFLIQDVDVSGLVQEMTHLLRVSIGKQTRLQLHLGEGLPAVQGDATQLRQVVMNLVVNASDAIGDADGVISVSTSLVDASSEVLASAHLAPDLPAGRYIAVEVTDTGEGMDAETLARVFDPFFTTKFTGRGLGLAAALGIMRGHRGAIKVSSAPGEGTTFRLLLPATSAGVEARTEVVETAEWRGSGLVLVVDDEPTVRAVTARALKAFGFEVLEAVDGAEGVELFRERAGDVACVLLDMTMPRMNGDEAFVEIKRIDPEARVVLMSGFSEQDAIERFRGRGLAGFIQKPYELSELRSMLRSAIEGD